MTANRTHVFKSDRARKRYLALYEKRAAEWPVPSIPCMVDTAFGRTFVRVSCPADGPPIVMLPGVGSPGYTLAANAGPMSERFATYVVDNIHDNGLSVETRTVTGAGDFAQWLDEVVTGLGLDDGVNLVGLSYGGWISVHYALRHPDRVTRLVLLAPAGTVAPIPLGFIWRGILAFLPFRFPIRNMMRWIATDRPGDPESRRRLEVLTEDTFVAQRCFNRRKMVPPVPLTDDQWRALSVPTLFLAGDREVIYDPHRVIARLADVAPQVRAEVIPDVSHDFFLVRADEVSRRVLDFLEEGKSGL